MDYNQTLEYLFSQTTVFQRDGAAAYKPGLETARALSAAFGNPHRRLPRAIHIAGTNGKGSTAHTLAAIMQCAGLRTGLYTSPHLTDFRERIRVNGEMIPHEAVTDFVERYLGHPELTSLQPSFFELTTIMAFEWFASQQVDVAIIEVGLGGRLDTTNIITPSLSIITNISPDHTALLGSTPTEIAAEKAGIIKAGVPVVIGEAGLPEVRQVFISKAAEAGAPIRFARPLEKAEALPDGSWLYNDSIHGSLRGDFQQSNAATVITALDTLAWPEITPEAVACGFDRVETLTGLRGRLSELTSLRCRAVYDTGHNPGAWHYIGPWLASVTAPRRVAVIGFAADKDVDAILALMPESYYYVFTRPSGNRGLEAAELSRKAGAHGLRGAVVPSVADAVGVAQDIAGPDGFIFIGGSNFVIADMLASFHD